MISRVLKRAQISASADKEVDKGATINTRKSREEGRRMAWLTYPAPSARTSTAGMSPRFLATNQFYNGDWLKRAAAAKFGIYGNSAAEALYPIATKEANGEPLDGSKHNYTRTFAADALPPVKAFWSLTMYDEKTQQLIENPVERYLLNSAMLPTMRKNPDGSLTLFIQKDSPGPDKEANWLPAPDGPIYMLLRLYWPNTEAPSILPPGEGTWKPPGIVNVKETAATAMR